MQYAMLLFMLAQVAGSTAPAQDAISAGPVSLVPSPGSGVPSVAFDLIDSTDKAVTAWHVNIEAVLPDGTVTRMGFGKDAYAAYAGVIRDRGDFVPAHSAIHVDVPLRDIFNGIVPSQAPQVTVRVGAVIFADRTWLGDEGHVRAFFEQRDRAYVAMTDVITTLRKAALTAHGVEALRAALSDLNRRDQTDPDNPAKVIMRRNLDVAIRGSQDPDKMDREMRDWLTSLEARWQAAQDHRVQGPRADIK